MTGMESLQGVARRREIRLDSTTPPGSTLGEGRQSVARLGFTMPVGKVWGAGGIEASDPAPQGSSIFLHP